MSWSAETRCLYCDKKLPLYRKFTQGQFCSSAHHKAYWADQERLAIERLQQTHDNLKSFRDGVPEPAVPELVIKPWPVKVPVVEEIPAMSGWMATQVDPGLARMIEFAAPIPEAYDFEAELESPLVPSVVEMRQLRQAGLTDVWVSAVSTGPMVQLAELTLEGWGIDPYRPPTPRASRAGFRVAGKVHLTLLDWVAARAGEHRIWSLLEPMPGTAMPVAQGSLALSPDGDFVAKLVEELIPAQHRMFALPLVLRGYAQAGVVGDAQAEELNGAIWNGLVFTPSVGAERGLRSAHLLKLPEAVFAASGTCFHTGSNAEAVETEIPALQSAVFFGANPVALQVGLGKIHALPVDIEARGMHAKLVAEQPAFLAPEIDAAPAIGELAPVKGEIALPIGTCQLNVQAMAAASIQNVANIAPIAPEGFSTAIPAREVAPLAAEEFDPALCTRLAKLAYRKSQQAVNTGYPVALRPMFPLPAEPLAVIPASKLQPLDAKPVADLIAGETSFDSPLGPGPNVRKLPPIFAHAVDFWQNAPRDLKMLAVAIPVLLGLAFHPSLPKVALAAPQDNNASGGFTRVVNEQWSSVRKSVLNRAAVALNEDFRSGLDDWASPGDSLTEWNFDNTGFVKPGPLALYRPSMGLSDYQLQFLGVIDKQALSWVVRAKDFENYQVIKLEVTKAGPIPQLAIMRYSVIRGKAQDRSDIPVPNSGNSELYLVQVDVQGSDFTLSVQGNTIDTWSEPRLDRGGVGFFSANGEQSRLRWIQVTHQYDMLGRLCAFLAPYNIPSTNGSWQP